MDDALRFLEILKVLARHRVQFVIVGGVAAILEGAPVSTFDLDVVYSRLPDNLERLAAALQELNAIYKDPAGRRLVPDASKLATMNVHLLRTLLGPLDLLVRVRGDLDYAVLIDRSIEYVLGESRVLVLGLEAVIECKQFANRDKDRAALPILLRTLELKRTSGAPEGGTG